MDKLLIIADLCTSNAGKRLFGFMGKIFDFILIIVPIIIILIGSIDFIKATIAQNQDDMKKAKNLFIKRLIVGVAIFFVSPIVNFLIGLVGFETTSPCMTCFTDPDNKMCEITNEKNQETENSDGNTSNEENNEKNEIEETVSETGGE